MTSSISNFHSYSEDSIKWRLVPSGVEIEGCGIERTRGKPVTVTGTWEKYNKEINSVARDRKIPCELILATICTETRGDQNALRKEPGYRSDEETPHRISAGLMQTLLSTAREAMKMSFGRDWLFEPINSINAGSAYMCSQYEITMFDPPLVAAAYNAGKLKYQGGKQNRWKLRQYRIGTGEHCDRFVKWFNDAVFVLNDHSIRPAYCIRDILDYTADSVKPKSEKGSKEIDYDKITVKFGDHAKAEDMSDYAMGVLKDVLASARLTEALVSSTYRDPANQARVMYNNIEEYGVEHQKNLYGRSGDKVIDEYVLAKNDGDSPAQIKSRMEQKIIEVGPGNVSRHSADLKKINVFDVAPSSIKNRRDFEKAIKAEKRISKYIFPPRDPGYHLEIPLKDAK